MLDVKAKIRQLLNECEGKYAVYYDRMMDRAQRATTHEELDAIINGITPKYDFFADCLISEVEGLRAVALFAEHKTAVAASVKNVERDYKIFTDIMVLTGMHHEELREKLAAGWTLKPLPNVYGSRWPQDPAILVPKEEG